MIHWTSSHFSICETFNSDQCWLFAEICHYSCLHPPDPSPALTSFLGETEEKLAKSREEAAEAAGQAALEDGNVRVEWLVCGLVGRSVGSADSLWWWMMLMFAIDNGCCLHLFIFVWIFAGGRSFLVVDHSDSSEHHDYNDSGGGDDDVCSHGSSRWCKNCPHWRKGFLIRHNDKIGTALWLKLYVIYVDWFAATCSIPKWIWPEGLSIFFAEFCIITGCNEMPGLSQFWYSVIAWFNWCNFPDQQGLLALMLDKNNTVAETDI